MGTFSDDTPTYQVSFLASPAEIDSPTILQVTFSANLFLFEPDAYSAYTNFQMQIQRHS